jgi:hypothetical protein
VLGALPARRYWPVRGAGVKLHVLASRRVEERASAVPGSRQRVLLTPAALYARLVAGSASVWRSFAG